MAYMASSKMLVLGRLAEGVPPSLPLRSTAVVIEAAGTPAARFLPLPFSSLGQLVQPLKKGCIKNLPAVASSNFYVALEDSAIRQMTTYAARGQGSRHQGGPGRTRRP
jgi:hypothetical protein